MELSARIPLTRLAWLGAGIPFVAVHLAYALSVHAQLVPLCLPYLDGCTSISRAARHGSGNLVFKAMMVVDAALLAFYWRRLAQTLSVLRTDAPRRTAAVRALGWLACGFLVLYAAFLGVDGRFYQWLRRYGITVYFAGTVLAEMLAALLSERLAALSRARHALLATLCAALLALGLASIPLRALDDDGSLVNVVEWWYALLMIAGYVVLALALPRGALSAPAAP